MRNMKTKNFKYAWCVLVLLTACQAKKVQTKAGVNGTNGTQTAMKTSLDNPANREENVSKVTVSGNDALYGNMTYVITHQIDASADLFRIVMSRPAEGGAVEDRAYEISSSDQAKLYATLSAFFKGQVKISSAQIDPKNPPKSSLSVKIGVFSGGDQEFQNAFLEGAGSETLLVDLDQFFVSSDQNNEAKVKRLGDRKLVSFSVQTSGGGSIAYSVGQSDADDEAYTIKVATYNFKEVNTAIEIDQSAGKAFQAISDLFYGKLEVKPSQPNTDSAPTGTWTKMSLTPVRGVVVESNNPYSDAAVQSALSAIRAYIDQKIVDTNVEARADAITCSNLNLNGVWQSDLVSDRGDVIRVISTIVQAGTNSDGSLNFTGTDEANGSKASTSYKYSPASCILEKTSQPQAPQPQVLLAGQGQAQQPQTLPAPQAQPAGNQQKLFKVIFVGGASRQLVKIAPCQDQACTQVDTSPGYTDMAVLKRLK
jgi:hypothetical protein